MQQVVGIDFGTSNSCMSIYHDGHFKIIPDECGNTIIPTCVYFDKSSSDVLVGNVAYELQNSNTSRIVVTNLKRLLALTYSEYLRDPCLQDFFLHKNLDIVETTHHMCGIKLVHDNKDRVVPIIDIIQLFFKYLLTNITQVVQDTKSVVITVPVHYTNIQKDCLVRCVEGLGFNVLRFVHEPTSAALVYAHENQTRTVSGNSGCENVLVVDCGGGTTDVTLLQMDHDIQLYQVKSASGNQYLGGEDLTKTLMEHVCKKLNIHNATSKQLNNIRIASETAKRQLTYATNATIHLESLNEHVTLRISRQQFQELGKTFFASVQQLVSDVLTDYPCTIHRVVLVGGTTKIPKVTTICKSLTKDAEICSSMTPDHVVCMGAALQGALLNNTANNTSSNAFDMTLVDVIPYAIGIETNGSIMMPIISKNSNIPVSKTCILTNSDDYVQDIDLRVYRGHRLLVHDCTLIAVCKLTGLDKSKKKGEMHIKVTLHVDSNASLHVYAQDTITSQQVSLDIALDPNTIHEPGSDDLDFILQDSTIMSLLQAKLELQDCLDERLEWCKNIEHPEELTTILNACKEIIQSYKSYTPLQLRQCKTDFEELWHHTMLSGSPLNKT